MTFDPFLTRDEHRVLVMLANGKERKEIAQALGLSIDTAKNRIEAVCVKLGAENSHHAIAIGFCTDILVPGDIDGFSVPARNAS